MSAVLTSQQSTFKPLQMALAEHLESRQQCLAEAWMTTYAIICYLNALNVYETKLRNTNRCSWEVEKGRVAEGHGSGPWAFRCERLA